MNLKYHKRRLKSGLLNDCSCPKVVLPTRRDAETFSFTPRFSEVTLIANLIPSRFNGFSS